MRVDTAGSWKLSINLQARQWRLRSLKLTSAIQSRLKVSKEKYNFSRNYCMRTLLKFMKLLGKKRKSIFLWNFVQMVIFSIELWKMDRCLKNKLLGYYIKFYRDFFISKKWEYRIVISNLRISSLIAIGILKLLILDSAASSTQ